VTGPTGVVLYRSRLHTAVAGTCLCAQRVSLGVLVRPASSEAGVRTGRWFIIGDVLRAAGRKHKASDGVTCPSPRLTCAMLYWRVEDQVRFSSILIPVAIDPFRCARRL
jgi:hypothetical protein